MRRRYSVLATAAVAAAVLTTTSGCGVGLGDLPLAAPGSGGGGYTVTANFANALNLPNKAKVRLAGADVGEVARMTVSDYTAQVQLRIREDVILPVGTRAQLRTATPLGDVYVALDAPADAAPGTAALHDGDTIAQQATSAAATVEELLTTTSLLVNGGAIRNLTSIVNGMGRSVGDRGDHVGALLDQSTELVTALAARSDDIRLALAETNRLVSELAAQRVVIDDFVSAAGPVSTTLNAHAQQALTLVRQVDGITEQLSMFPVLQGGEIGGIIANLNRLSIGLNDAVLNPEGSLAAMNALLPTVIKLASGTSAHGNVDLQDFAIGALPDPNHRGDPGNRVPDASDWQALVGSLTYTLLKLRDRVIGPPR
ncbi:MlaD family protein [Nocardia bovistercoris]|uniref:MCE family protein n=1 Tax=Nocardia bovistercoris TaxID=2785916 RepID=A0A931N3P2_9NOCA|nr:MlaD family protein [Nocardia bovistercoris]MBH0778039.1 MCE family protein [Nocardia bovistercoris]